MTLAKVEMKQTKLARLRNWWWRARIWFRFSRREAENKYWKPIYHPTPEMQKLTNDFNVAVDEAWERNKYRLEGDQS